MEDVEFHEDGAELGFVEFQSDFLEDEGREQQRWRRDERILAFIAMKTLVGLWRTFLTVP